MKRRTRSERGYDQLAPFYSTIERMTFGHQLQNARVALMEELPVWSNLLLLGDGNGRLLERLCRQQPESGTITSVDHSGMMLRRQRARACEIGMEHRVRFVHSDAREYSPESGAYDVIVAAFFLDCFDRDELSENLPKWLAGMDEEAVFYYVDFVSPVTPLANASGTRRWTRLGTLQRLRAELMLWSMHVFFCWQTGIPNRELIDVEPQLLGCGLAKTAERLGGGGMIATRIYTPVGKSGGNSDLRFVGAAPDDEFASG